MASRTSLAGLRERLVMDPREAVNKLWRDEHVNLDLETGGLSPWKDPIATVQLYGVESGTECVLHIRGRMPDFLRKYLSRPDVEFTGHNVSSFDMLFLANNGVDIYAPSWYDTLLAECVIATGNRHTVRVDLGSSAKRRLGIQVKRELEGGHGGWMNATLTDEQLDYAISDVRKLHLLKAEQEGFAAERGVTTALKLEHAIMPEVVRMTMNGLPFRADLMYQYLDWSAWKAKEARAFLYERLGAVNLNSTPQKVAACARLGFRPMVFNPRSLNSEDGGLAPSMAKEVLAEVANDPDNPFAELAEALMLASTMAQRGKMYNPEFLRRFGVYHGERPGSPVEFEYDPGLRPVLDPSAMAQLRLHARFWQCGTDTGRFSASDPNLQQIPKDARWVFRAPEGHVFFSVDYSQIEVCVAASQSKDAALMKAINEGGEDTHRSIAALQGRKRPEDVTDDERKVAKAQSFRLLFGGGHRGFQAFANMLGLPMTESEAKAIKDQFFGTFQGLARERALAYGMASRRGPIVLRLPTTMRRVLTGWDAKATTILNTKVQGGAAAGMKYAILEFKKRHLHYNGAVVHDETCGAVPERMAEEYVHEVCDAMVEGMGRVIPDVKVRVAPKVGRSWAAQDPDLRPWLEAEGRVPRLTQELEEATA